MTSDRATGEAAGEQDTSRQPDVDPGRAAPATEPLITETRIAGQLRSRTPALAGLAVLIAVFALFPLVFTNPTVTTIAVVTLIFVAVASAWNLFSGFSGYLSLGHAVFYGTGAYFLVVAAKDWNLNGTAVFWLLPLAGAVAALLAVPLGLVALRVRRHTFVVITIAFFFIAQLSASNLTVTGGSSGLLAPVPNWAPATYNNPFYYVGLLLAVAAVALSVLIRRSRFGLQLRAIRDDEDRAAGLGVRAMPVKLGALVLSAFITGMAGGLWVYFIGQAVPQFVFDPLFDLAVVLMAFFGGLGTIAGPVLGALILEPTQQYLYLQQSNGYESEILFGALFLVVILFLPRGVLPTAGEWLTPARLGRLRAAWPGRRADRIAQPVQRSKPPAAGSTS
ncbi:MAG TPA: branched-chain amino acid ABC transporter permease [Streptosporangiaceae bacterium]|nr:branched-chain amino acid ABC transporter permease [Streptosporangiaceae bacterium]